MNVSRGLLDSFDINGLNTALSESTCLGVEVDATAGRLQLALEVLTLPADGPAPTEAKVLLTFTGVTRVAASLRIQRWDDIEARVLPLTLDQLDEAIESFGGGGLHGWEFIDLDDSGWTLWSELLSFDTVLDQRIAAHVIEFSQEEGIDPRELDVRVWFDKITVTDLGGKEIPMAEFIEGGRRWWAAHDSGDARASKADVAPPL
ncbi:hypothetical protein [Nocardia rhizosphaerihabitans]|uniref:Ribosome maturation factor RimP n=1 Tax=Nocardia rhizosphaerihabitans TaxID=1691570 RepID=A0ABQ2KNN8_9NOCA|nr:hypothetical protein [Nocardia rhizosphaerihabitans]GGN88582.1 hypothetical protein GCM10011610_46170 [Nocardia rhizosphaerihabitans]